MAWFEPGQKPTPADQIRHWDRIAAFVIGIILVLLGLQLLWATPLVWGTANDLLIAFLWGLGLHAVGGQAVADSIQGITAKLSKPPQ